MVGLPSRRSSSLALWHCSHHSFRQQPRSRVVIMSICMCRATTGGGTCSSRVRSSVEWSLWAVPTLLCWVWGAAKDFRPHLIRMQETENILIHNVRLMNSPQYHGATSGACPSSVCFRGGLQLFSRNAHCLCCVHQPALATCTSETLCLAHCCVAGAAAHRVTATASL